jgi:hypothetical protein
MKKPFIKIPIAHIKVKRKWYNPVRLLLGDYYMMDNLHPKFYDQFDLDVKDIKFISSNKILFDNITKYGR